MVSGTPEETTETTPTTMADTTYTKYGQEVLVTGYNGERHLGKIIYTDGDGQILVAVFAHCQFDGLPNEADIAMHFRRFKPADVQFLD